MAARLSDTGVIGIYQDELRTAIAVVHYREGELCAKDTQLFTLREESEADILSAFLTQYYSDRGNLPKQILLSFLPEDSEHVERLLTEEAGHKVSITRPQRGEKVELVRLAVGNAEVDCVRAMSSA